MRSEDVIRLKLDEWKAKLQGARNYRNALDNAVANGDTFPITSRTYMAITEEMVAAADVVKLLEWVLGEKSSVGRTL